MSKRIALYRAMFGNYDDLPKDLFFDQNIDYFFFTDAEDLVVPNYNLVVFDKFEKSALNNRYLKIMSHEILVNYDVVIYIDANIAVCRDLTPLINNFVKSGKDFGLFKHPWNNNIIEEYKECVIAKKATRDNLMFELAYYEEQKIEPKIPHTDNSIIFRGRLNDKSKEGLAAWFDLVSQYSGRDQISFPFIRSMFDFQEIIYNFSPRDLWNPYFVVFPHRKNLPMFKRIYETSKCLIKSYIKHLAWQFVTLFPRSR